MDVDFLEWIEWIFIFHNNFTFQYYGKLLGKSMGSNLIPVA